MRTRMVLSAGLGAALVLGVAACGGDEPRDYDAEPTQEVEEGQAPDCVFLYDETDTEDDEGEPLGTYCREG